MIVYSYMSTSNSWYDEHYYNSVTITIIIILRDPPVIKRGSGKLPIYINDDFPSENDHSWGLFQPATFDYQGYILDTCLNRIWISDHLSHLSLIYHYGFWIIFLFWPPKDNSSKAVHFSIHHPLLGVLNIWTTHIVAGLWRICVQRIVQWMDMVSGDSVDIKICLPSGND